jgi:hypothetical protein
MAFNPNIFNQFLYSPQTTGMQIGNMQGMFNPEVLLANRNNPSGRINYFGDNRFNEQKKKLEGLGSNKTINTNERPNRRGNTKPSKTIGDVIDDAKKIFEGGDGTEGEKDGTYGGFTREDIESIQQKGFDQQNKLFQQGLAMGGIDKIAQGMQAGPQAFLQNVLPQMYAGQAALLSAGAANTRSLANVYSQPFVPIPKMGYYS